MDPFLGEIRMFAGNFPPKNWAYCDGALLPIQQYTALFSLLGTYYGGDGRTNFALPSLGDRVPIFWQTGPGLSQRELGESGGSANVQLIASEMAAHTHSPLAASGAGNSTSPQNSVWSASSTRDKQFAPPPATADMSAQALGPSGGNQPHANQQPYLAVSYIIAMAGIFPARP